MLPGKHKQDNTNKLEKDEQHGPPPTNQRLKVDNVTISYNTYSN